MENSMISMHFQLLISAAGTYKHHVKKKKTQTKPTNVSLESIWLSLLIVTDYVQMDTWSEPCQKWSLYYNQT